MIKAILLTIILLSCTGIGRALSNIRKHRYELIGEILAAMRVLRLRMLNSMEPLGILLRKSDCFIFKELGNNLWDGEGLPECWKNLVEKERGRSGRLASLTQSDIEIMNSFFSNLGKTGRDEQNELFARVIRGMEEAHTQAKNMYSDASKIYTALGTLVGIAVCILIV